MRLLYLVCLFILSGMAVADDIAEQALFPIPDVQPQNPKLVSLGKALFHDARLSSDNTISCASCHDMKKGGADGLSVSLGVMDRAGVINTPTVFNSVFNLKQFWDGRAVDLFEQVDGPIHNPKEMAMEWTDVLAKLQQDQQYQVQFAELFDDGITVNNLKNAIVAFESSLITPDSRFDRYLKGEKTALNEQEIKGYQLFHDYGCISCHQGVGIGGNMFQKLGVMKAYFKDGNANSVDLGRFNVTKKQADRHVFKVPSLRNVALTAPYLHNGKAKTLTEAVKVMMEFQLGVTAPERDVEQIVAFLKTLTGKLHGVELE